MWLHSPLITAIHGFSLRKGGVSPAPFDSLNMGGSLDDPSHIAENRRRALGALGIEFGQTAYLKQVHSNTVCLARTGVQTGDALVTKEKNIALAVSAADCYPLLFHDPVNEVIGAAHAGWRGTLSRIAGNTIGEMIKLGADVGEIRVAIGPGICRNNFEVSQEIIDEFMRARFPDEVHTGRLLDLLACNRFVLEECGVLPAHIRALNRCTTEPDFFSHRRDKGQTGRMWAVIALTIDH